MTGRASIIITNGRVLTMDDANPRAEAVALQGNTILAAGPWREVEEHKGPATRVIDAAGGTVLPGFIEGHMHLFPGATELDHLQLFGVKGFETLRARTLDFAAANPGGDLIIGESADYTILSDTERVTRHHLDRILKDRPLLLYSPDHHTAWANTIALEKAGILRGKSVGVGNEIVIGPDGLAAGELREGEAIEPVVTLAPGGQRHRLGLSTGGDPVPPATASERAADKRTLLRGLQHCARYGITSFHNMDGNGYQLELLAELDREGKLPARAKVPFHLKNFMDLEALETASDLHERYRSDKLSSGFVKMFMDGVLDSWTAVMVTDYADRPGHNCEPLFSQDHFNRAAIEADRRGLQIAVHAIGDGAVRMVLDGYEAARRANGSRDSRHRIEHVEVVHPDDIARFARLGVLASMQPPHPPGMAGLPLEPTVSKIGPARWPYAYAWRTLRDAGARLVFGTDWPVSAIDPIASVEYAVTRTRWRDDMPDQRQTLMETLASYTREGAYAEHKEHRKGQLKAGMLADAVVLSRDIESVEPASIHTLRPVVTICDGVVTHEA